MADEIDLTKTAKGVKDSLDNLKDDVTTATRDLKPEWRNLLNNMKEFNAPLAKSIADIRETSKNTAMGILSSRKLLKTAEIIDEFSATGEELDAKKLEKLKKFTDDIKDFDFQDYQKAQEAVTKVVQANKDIADSYERTARQESIHGEERKELNKKIADNRTKIQEAREHGDLKEVGNRQRMENHLIEERGKLYNEILERAKEEGEKQIAKNIESVKDETELRNTYNEMVEGEMQKLSTGADSVTGKTLAGIKHLSGGVLDIGGMLDDVVEGWVAIKDVGKGIGEATTAAFDFVKPMVLFFWKPLKGFIMQTLGFSKIIEKLTAAYKMGMKAWIAAQWKNLKATTLFTKMQSILNKVSWSVFTTWIATKWAEVTLMIRQTAQRLAMIATEVVAWAARMIAKALEVATMLLPVLPIIAIAVAVLALAALLIWGGMQLYEKSELFRAMVDTVIGYFKDIVSIIGDIFGGFMDFFTGLFTGDFDLMFSGLSDIFGGLWDLILAPFRAISSFIKDTFGIDIGGWLTDMLRKWLPGWALNLLGMGGSEDTDAMQAGLVGEAEKADQKAGLKSAEESGLYEKNILGESVVDKEKIAGASDAELQSIVRDNDISDEDRSLILDTLNQRQVEAGGPDVSAQIAAAREEGLSGADLAERTAQIKAGEYTGGGDTANVSNTSQVDASTTNQLNVSKNARETDPTLSRLSTASATP
jgi:hypothetical protein